MRDPESFIAWDQSSDEEITRRNIERVKIDKQSDAQKAKLIVGLQENFRRRTAERMAKLLSS